MLLHRRLKQKPNKNEEAKKVANSQASHDLASLNERKAMVDEFNSLIEKAKKTLIMTSRQKYEDRNVFIV